MSMQTSCFSLLTCCDGRQPDLQHIQGQATDVVVVILLIIVHIPTLARWTGISPRLFDLRVSFVSFLTSLKGVLVKIGLAAFHWNNATKRQRKGTMVSDFECDSVAGHAMSGGQRTVVVSELPVHQLLDGVRMHSVWCDHSRSLSKQSSVQQLRQVDLFKCKLTAGMAKPSSTSTVLLPGCSSTYHDRVFLSKFIGVTLVVL